jgi:hypothetical protein
MIKGRRARNGGGSPHRDRPCKMGRVHNWGLPVRLARMLHEVQDLHVLHG